MNAAPNSNATVFFVDDDAEIRTTLTRALTKRGFKVASFASAQDFLATYDPSEPGCLVLDYGMPDLNGLELQELLQKQNFTIPIIFVSGHGGVPETVQAIKAGAIDFLEKPFRQNVLVDCINQAFAADAKRRETQDLHETALVRFQSLTSREREIALFMIDNPSNTASKEIGRTLNISPRTVDHHRARILEKMGVGSVAELLALSLGDLRR